MSAARRGVPWVPDYRDLWSNSTYYGLPGWRRRIDRRVEERWLHDAAAVTASSELFARDLQALAGTIPVIPIRNGYSRPELDAIRPVDLGQGIHIAYPGIFYGTRRDPEPLLRAMRDQPELADVVLHFVGPERRAAEELAMSYGLQGRVVFHGVLPRDQALGIVKGSDIALLLTWNDPRDAGMIPAKLFEYLGLSRPILALGYADGLAAEILRDTDLGFLSNEPEGIASALAEIRSGRGPSGKPFDFSRAADFERNVQLARWESLIHEVVARASNG
jgi:glycosyltransferase involved in cell wall biosynthesis